MILDSGKTDSSKSYLIEEFESVVILDSGKTGKKSTKAVEEFESVVILDSGKTSLIWRGFLK